MSTLILGPGKLDIEVYQGAEWAVIGVTDGATPPVAIDFRTYNAGKMQFVDANGTVIATWQTSDGTMAFGLGTISLNTSSLNLTPVSGRYDLYTQQTNGGHWNPQIAGAFTVIARVTTIP